MLERLSHFRIIEKLGEGGMGIVFKAEDEKLRRIVALKVLPEAFVADRDRRARFLREAQAAAAVTHPGIAAIYEIGEQDGVVFIAMEYVQGATLHWSISGKPLPMQDTLRLGVEIAEALERAHGAGVVHRDLKPDNILVQPDGHVKILDFGLAKRLLRSDANNLEGRELLIGPKGLATRIMAGGNDGSIEIVKRACAGYPPRGVAPWTFESWDLPLDLEARGVGKGSALVEYPYRDDGLQLWEALARYVTEYLGIYYPTDADVAKDAEVQAWVAELASPEGGKVARIAPPRSIAELATILTRILFTCGPQHSAVNFAQYDSAAFAPNMAAAAYARPPQNLRSLSGEELDALLLRVLPPPEQAAFQLELIAMLTCYRFDRLGFYQPGDFLDPQTQRAISGFQKSLEQASFTIATRNRSRAQPYPWMKPENILNSTSI